MEIKDYREAFEELNPGDALNGLKAEVAWVLGLDEYSDEFEELLEV